MCGTVGVTECRADAPHPWTRHERDMKWQAIVNTVFLHDQRIRIRWFLRRIAPGRAAHYRLSHPPMMPDRTIITAHSSKSSKLFSGRSVQGKCRYSPKDSGPNQPRGRRGPGPPCQAGPVRYPPSNRRLTLQPYPSPLNPYKEEGRSQSYARRGLCPKWVRPSTGGLGGLGMAGHRGMPDRHQSFHTAHLDWYGLAER
jgi:hypothetical protein